MSTLITSDIHLTNHERDEYRWSLFPWLKEQIQKHNTDTLMFLGDTTDAKDKHTSRLTNRIVDTFTELSKCVKHLYILRGNHDYIDETTPYFRFLNHINGIRFIIEPTIAIINGNKSLLVPNTKDFSNLEIEQDIKYLFCHQTFKGAKGENGVEMDGIDTSIFENWNGQVISGDVHTPQRMCKNRIIYCGSPYHVHFGDQYLPRVLLMEADGKLNSLYFKTVRRFTVNITTPKELESLLITKGDQIKVRISLDNITDWESSKRQIMEFCESHEIYLHQTECIRQNASLLVENQKVKLQSLSTKDIFDRFCKISKLNEDIIKYGEKIINDNK